MYICKSGLSTIKGLNHFFNVVVTFMFIYTKSRVLQSVPSLLSQESQFSLLHSETDFGL